MLDQTAAEITSLTGNTVLPVSADVRDPAAIAAAVDACREQLGLPDILINNAAGNFISPTERYGVVWGGGGLGSRLGLGLGLWEGGVVWVVWVKVSSVRCTDGRYEVCYV